MPRARALVWFALFAAGVLLLVLALRSRAAPPVEGLASASPPAAAAPAPMAPAPVPTEAAAPPAADPERTQIDVPPPQTVVRGVIARQDDGRPIVRAKALLVLQRRGEPAPPASAVRPWIEFTGADGSFEVALDLAIDVEWDGALYLYYPGFHLRRLPVAALEAGRTYDLGRQLLTPMTDEERTRRRQRPLSGHELRALLQGDPVEVLDALTREGETGAEERTPR
jgi:hypothetical protein